MKKFTAALLAGVFSAVAVAPAFAGGMWSRDGGSLKDEPVVEERKLDLTANVALTSDYIFRGFSQTDRGPAIQGGFDATYGIFYAGVWASNLDFGANPCGLAIGPDDCANIEIDVYAGIAPSYNGVNFNLGVIYYAYPQADDPIAELDYVELKAGVSTEILPKLTVGATLFYSPDYTLETGDNYVGEFSAAYDFGEMAGVGVAVSGLYGIQEGDETDGGIDYNYWNAGLTFSFLEKFSLDVRYWDTDISGCEGATIFQCDETVVGTLKATF